MTTMTIDSVRDFGRYITVTYSDGIAETVDIDHLANSRLQELERETARELMLNRLRANRGGNLDVIKSTPIVVDITDAEVSRGP